MPDSLSLLQETHDAVIRLEMKVDSLLETRVDHESRIRGLERWRWGIPSGLIVAVVTGLLALLGVGPNIN